MDLYKFLDLLNNRALFFPKLGSLQDYDRFEGKLTQKQDSVLAAKIGSSPAMEQLEAKKIRWLSECCVSCWHMSDVESNSMWKTYGSAIAVVSSIGRLVKSLDQKRAVWIRPVKYGTFPEAYEKSRFGFCKRSEFADERELRAMTELQEQGPGVNFEVNLCLLFEKIVVAPSFAEWQSKAIEATCRRYDHDFPVVASTI